MLAQSRFKAGQYLEAQRAAIGVDNPQYAQRVNTKDNGNFINVNRWQNYKGTSTTNNKMQPQPEHLLNSVPQMIPMY
jgi:hypothetical protein